MKILRVLIMFDFASTSSSKRNHLVNNPEHGSFTSPVVLQELSTGNEQITKKVPCLLAFVPFAQTLNVCSSFIHNKCLATSNECDNSENVVCKIYSNKQSINENREKARSCLENQAKRIKMSGEKCFPPIPVGSFVVIAVPEVDRDKIDAKNILAIEIIMDVTDDEYYKVGCTSGITDSLYSRNQMSMCIENFVSQETSNIPASLRKASSNMSLNGGQ
ncbi:hypothetical protein ILUMI_17743 [Ignelater luminosus]|uniref:Uncharacterized protein n=1 Tax=Ignelater luminosus TaxID=2038154 RepID=A0A8K0CRP3_IGNLU|nr:hypothetical protein ILUMI_17743 [Ignelater luminosus]